MNKINSTKILALIIALILLFIQIPYNVFANSNPNDITVENIEINSKNNYIKPGDTFTLTLIFKNNTGLDSPKSSIQINNSENFSLKNTGSKKDIIFPELSISNKSDSITFDLVYNGGNNTQLPFTIFYKNGSIDDYVSIYKAKPENIDKENYRDKDRDYEKPVRPEKEENPHVTVIGNKTTIVSSGEKVELPIKFKNTSDSHAYSVSTTIELENEPGVFINGSGYEDIGKLNRGAEGTATFDISIDKFAEEKSYPLKVNFHFYNSKDKNFTTSDIIYIKVKGEDGDFQLIIDEVKLTPEDNIKPGSSIQVQFKLRNISIVPIRDIQLQLEGLETQGFSLNSGTNIFTIPYLSGKDETFITFPLKVSQKLRPGNHELKLNTSYKNLRGQRLKEESKFFIPIKGASLQNSSLIIEKIKSPTVLGPNQTGNISFNIRNRGQNEARNIAINTDLTDPEGLVPKSITTIKIDTLKPGESKNLSFSFFASKETPTKNYPINFKIQYFDDFSEGETPYLLEQFLGIFVDNPKPDETNKDKEPGKKSIPKLIIDKYNFSSDMVEAGQNFNMTLSFYNTNKHKSVKNIKIYLTAEENISEDGNAPSSSGSSVFSPVKSSNTFYIEEIPPKGKVEKSLTMFTIPDAAAKTHVITANFEYEDGDNDEYKATELIGVPVIQKSKLEVSELNYAPEIISGEQSPITVEFYNTGKGTLYNMMVRIEGEGFQTENGTHYIGNFSPGTSEYFDGTIIPNKEGPIKGNIIFSYEDSRGENQEVKRPFNIVATAMAEDDFSDNFQIENEQNFLTKFKCPIIILISGLILFTGFKLYRKKKQKIEDKDLFIDE